MYNYICYINTKKNVFAQPNNSINRLNKIENHTICYPFIPLLLSFTPSSPGPPWGTASIT